MRLNRYIKITSGDLQVEGKLRNCFDSWRRELPEHNYKIYYWTSVNDNAAPSCLMDFSISDNENVILLDNVSMLLLASSYAYEEEWPGNMRHEGAGLQEGASKSNLAEEDSTATVSGENDTHGCTVGRNAWGLLIRPVPDTNKYMRAGDFRIASERGGLSHFQQQANTFVTII